MESGRLGWSPLPLLFTFDGKIDRGKFWGGYAMIALALMAWVGTSMVLTLPTELFSAVYLPLGLVAWWAWIALCVKRLHGMGGSGWWTLLTFIPLLGLFAILWIGTAENEDQ